jgi:flagellar biosynthesis protein FlhG
MLISDVHIDQAAGLRRISKPRPVRVIAVTSGKGGVG